MPTDTPMMRLLPIVLLLLLALPARAQQTASAPSDLASVVDGIGLIGGPNQFTGALGVSVIDGESFAALRLQPEIAIGKIGVGLDIPLQVSLSDGSFRSDEFTGGPGVLRLIRYLRYGQKRQDPIYAKVGDLSGATLGFGFLMYGYTNVGSFEERPVGGEIALEYDGTYGLEVIASSLTDAGVIGVRPYVRPLRAAGVDLPLLRDLEMGALYVTDRDSLATPGGEPVSAWGLDVGLPLNLGGLLNVTPYAAYGNFSVADGAFGTDPAANTTSFDGGSGSAIGASFRLNLIADLLAIDAKIERRFYDEHFVGSYFDGIYETSKLAALGDSAAAPLDRLQSANGEDGVFGALYGQVLNRVTLGGALAIPDRVETAADGTVLNGAYLRLVADAPDVIPKFAVRGTYHRGFIKDTADAFKLDENSSAEVRVGFKASRFLLVGTDYRWTFASVENEEGVKRIEATSFVFPFVALQLDLPFGNR